MKAIIFDFDGVVAHADVDAILRFSEAQKHNFLLPPDRILADYFYNNPCNRALDLGLATVEEVREAIRPLLWRGSRDEWMAWWRAVEDSYVVSEDMARLLSWLQPRYALGLLSDNHRGFHQWLERLPHVSHYFQTVLCSADMGIKKPARALFERIIERLGADFATTVYIDDDINNIRVLRLEGLASIHFESTTQTQRELALLLRHPADPPKMFCQES